MSEGRERGSEWPGEAERRMPSSIGSEGRGQAGTRKDVSLSSLPGSAPYAISSSSCGQHRSGNLQDSMR